MKLIDQPFNLAVCLPKVTMQDSVSQSHASTPSTNTHLRVDYFKYIQYKLLQAVNTSHVLGEFITLTHQFYMRICFKPYLCVYQTKYNQILRNVSVEVYSTTSWGG